MARLCGLFNEPGYLGTVLALVLCADKLNLKRKSNWILLIAGFMTFSLAFLLLLAIFLVFLIRKRPVLMIMLILFLILYVFILPYVQFSNPTIQAFINRIMIVDGTLAGDNRSNIYVDSTLSNLLNSTDAFWGYGTGYSSTADFGSVSTYKTYVIDYGVIGFILVYGSLLLASLFKTKRTWYIVAYISCFFISIYQRPYVFSIVYFVILFGGIEYIKQIYSAVPTAQKKE